MSVSQSSTLVHLHSAPVCQPGGGYLWAPPLPFGRQPPQLNYPPDTVPDPDHGPRLDIQHDQSGISTATHRARPPPLHSPPPTLHKPTRTPISSYSKGPGVFPSCCAKRASLLVVQFHRACGRDSREVVTPFVQVGTYPTRNFAALGWL